MHSGSPGSCGKGQGVTALSSSERGTSGEVGGELVWGVLWNFPARASLGNVLIILSGGGVESLLLFIGLTLVLVSLLPPHPTWGRTPTGLCIFALPQTGVPQSRAASEPPQITGFVGGVGLRPHSHTHVPGQPFLPLPWEPGHAAPKGRTNV